MNDSITRASGWVIRKGRQRTLSLMVVLMVALGSVVCGLAYVARDLDAGLLLPVAAIGMLVGWGLAASQSPGWLASILASLSGVALILLRVGHLGGELAAALWTLLFLPWSIWRWLLGGPPLDFTPTLLALAKLGTDAGALLARWGNWALTLVDGNPTFDPVAMALVWGLAIWTVAVWAGWKVRHHQPLRGLTPAIALLVVTLYYVGVSAFSLLPLLGAMLWLIALIRQDARERRWRASGVDFSRYIWADMVTRVATLSLALVVTAALMPSISVDKIVEHVERLTEEWGETESVGESLGLDAQPDPKTAGSSGVHVAGLPRSRQIGSGPELSRRVVMAIRTNDLRPGLPEPTRHYYWRSITYDRYNGHGWSTSQTEMVAYKTDEPATSEDVPFHRIVRQEVRVLGDLGERLHVTGVLITTDQDYRVAWRSPGDAFGATTKATAYRADSLVPVVSEGQLRSAGSDYPAWVRDRYLALPDTMPARVLALARDLTAAEPTPYGRTRAIETYVRAFPYTLDVPAPPFDREVVDYFLFDLQKGYCDYYATTMAVLARAAGLPARLVVGYTSGTYDAANVHYIVTEANAHTWVEIYFPEYGWVEFEPTGSRPAIERLSESRPIEWPEEELLEPGETLEPAAAWWTRLGWLLWLGLPGGLALLVLAGVVWSAAEDWWLRHLKPAAAAAMLYRRLQRHGRRLAVPMRAGDTPYEFAASLTGWVADLAQKGRWSEVLPPAVQEVRQLTGLYVQASYSSHLPGAADQALAIQIWQRLRWRLWLAWVWWKWKPRWFRPIRRLLSPLKYQR